MDLFDFKMQNVFSRPVLSASFLFTNVFAATVSAAAPEIVDNRPAPPLVPSITKIYHGSECSYIDLHNENSPQFYNNPVRYDPRGIWNEDDVPGGSTHVVCPIVRDKTVDNAVVTNGEVAVTVFVNDADVDPYPLWCRLHSMDSYGNLVDEDRDETAAGNADQALRLNITDSTPSGNHSLYCSLPEGDRIYSYRVKEFLY